MIRAGGSEGEGERERDAGRREGDEGGGESEHLQPMLYGCMNVHARTQTHTHV